MANESRKSILERMKVFVLGGSRNIRDRSIFHKLSLIAFFAWIGLGADGLSSSCYGPEEAFRALGEHRYLGIFVALATAVTIFVVSASYSQIIELFPMGGGGYVVASKLLTPTLGMVAGCALMVDYVLTIALSIASGVDALLSFLPPGYLYLKIPLTLAVVAVLTLMNLRGVKESVLPLVPIFLAFLVTHAVAILTALVSHAGEFGGVAEEAVKDIGNTSTELGVFGMLMLIMHSYGMGAGTYTGIEAVSNGMPILREPRVATGQRTMRYMAISLALVVLGLMVSYLLYNVAPREGKTLNAVLLEGITATWPDYVGSSFVILTLISEAILLFVAAQTGFLGGPRVLANMAADRWFPAWLSVLSDRLVIKNGILLMSAASLATILLAGGQVRLLVVLYAINVFITFVLSQAGMVRHWWSMRETVRAWWKNLTVVGVGLALCVFILVWVTVAKFFEGGWITVIVTAALATVAALVHRRYRITERQINLWSVLTVTKVLWGEAGPISLAEGGADAKRREPPQPDPKAETAVILVNGYNGLGLQMLASVRRYFGREFKNHIFVMVGVIDAGNFKGAGAVQQLQRHVWDETDRYVSLMRQNGLAADARTAVGTDVVEELEKLAPAIVQDFPQAVFFLGQLIMPKDTMVTRLLHNNVTQAVQRRLYGLGVPFVTLPVKVLP
ncbi:MAG: APC family permease [Planctomycetota bacterium]|nr:APC family permease [Planctomycetota bacterium]